MKTVLIAGFMLAMLVASSSYAVVAPAEPKEFAGTVENWSESDRHIRISGAEYKVSPDAEITDHLGRKMDVSSLRRGMSVGIMETDGEIQVLVVLPRGAMTSRQPGEQHDP